ncbi:hypothetical protein [Alkalihalophilus marmarensis]|uniref:hypothetical protein n=1 Tax=Alkalihalophilus marmarensis TaxID=521377 RepID=UPI002E231EE7|nr:hypothetical protein [Alkalihalophilus marmarensis]
MTQLVDILMALLIPILLIILIVLIVKWIGSIKHQKSDSELEDIKKQLDRIEKKVDKSR